MNLFKSVWQKILNFFFPFYCLVCDQEDYLLCPRCAEALIQQSKIQVLKSHEIKKIWVLTDYQNKTAQTLIKKLKFSFAKKALQDLQPLINAKIQEIHLPPEAVFCPVPLHFLRQNSRGFNQSDIIVESYQKAQPLAIKKILKRSRHTSPQSSLKAEDRKTNLIDAFTLDKKLATGLPKNTNIILVDDVVTTMTTLRECALTLIHHGFENVYALVLARSNS